MTGLVLGGFTHDGITISMVPLLNLDWKRFEIVSTFWETLTETFVTILPLIAAYGTSVVATSGAVIAELYCIRMYPPVSTYS